MVWHVLSLWPWWLRCYSHPTQDFAVHGDQLASWRHIGKRLYEEGRPSVFGPPSPDSLCGRTLRQGDNRQLHPRRRYEYTPADSSTGVTSTTCTGRRLPYALQRKGGTCPPCQGNGPHWRTFGFWPLPYHIRVGQSLDINGRPANFLTPYCVGGNYDIVTWEIATPSWGLVTMTCSLIPSSCFNSSVLSTFQVPSMVLPAHQRLPG